MSKIQKRSTNLLALGALGVVFGDIGTSPLYVLQAVSELGHIKMIPSEIFGVISLIIWSITLVVSIKYLLFIMRANNHGEGGIMALVALVQNTNISQKRRALLIGFGFLGVGMFYGDSVVTPAISVLSAVEGIKTVAPELSRYVIPTTLVVLFFLFLLQGRGTGTISKLFAPIMAIWFGVSAVAGALQVIQHPEVLVALSPMTAFGFLVSHPLVSFLTLGAVVLAITGAEALYADMGHFGRAPIQRAWFWFVFPALILNYLGQGALVAIEPHSIHSAYFMLYGEALRLPIIILATFATLIASQAVISGAFSLTRQAIQLGFAPRLLINHTSRTEEGQVYLPFMNWLIFAGVAFLVIVFGSSAKLAGAYGMAVSTTLIIDTILFLTVVRFVWKKSAVSIGLLALVFLSVDILFFSASLTKILHGGWLPITIGLVVFSILSTWTQARSIIGKERIHMEGSLDTFVKELRTKHPNLARLPGAAIYLGHHAGYAPLALHATVSQLHELHEKVVVVTIETANIPHIAEDKRVVLDNLGYEGDGISYVTLQFGFKDIPNVPHALTTARKMSDELDFDIDEASYFISLSKPILKHNHKMAYWRKMIYRTLARNAASATEYYKLPNDRTIEMTSYIDL